MLTRTDGSDGGTSAPGLEVGTRLRRLRGERALTIAQLAERSGVSSGMISQIERGNTNPSIKILQRLRAALGVNLWEVLDPAGAQLSEGGDSPYVLRRADRLEIVVGQTRLRKELLSPRKDRNLRFMLITLPPGGVSEDVIMGEGEKGGLVIEGRVRLSVGPDVSLLEEGDSFQFPSSLPHTLANPHGETATVLWIMSVLDSHI